MITLFLTHLSTVAQLPFYWLRLANLPITEGCLKCSFFPSALRFSERQVTRQRDREKRQQTRDGALEMCSGIANYR